MKETEDRLGVLGSAALRSPSGGIGHGEKGLWNPCRAGLFVELATDFGGLDKSFRFWQP